MSETRKGKHSGSYGKTWNLNCCSNPHPENNNAKEKLGRNVVIMELNKHFNCYGDCADFLGIDSSNIRKCCVGEQNTAGGYHICFEETFDENNNPYFGKPRGRVSSKAGKKQGITDKTIERIKKFNSVVLGKPVRCLETGEIFPTAQEAADKFGTTKSVVVAVCRGLKHSTKGHTFEYAPEFKQEYKRQEPAVIIMENELRFNSIDECASYMCCSYSSVERNLYGSTKQCVGYHICFADTYNRSNNPYFGLPRYSQPKQDYSKRIMPNQKKVMCVETGEVFDSIAEAGRITGCSNISNCCNGKRKCASKGMHFKFI